MMRFESVSKIEVPWSGTAVSIGNFDGVHIGHAALIRRLRAVADRLGVPAIAVTFDPHPAAVLDPHTSFVPLSWPERKERLLKRLGADEVIFLRADASFFATTASDFMEDILRRRLRVRGMVEGPDFRFGKDRAGSVDDLRRLALSDDLELELVPKVRYGDEIVSSSRIRRLVEAGEIEEANRRLAARYRIVGTVERGAGRGSKIGFPTANLALIPNLVPAAGVYAGRVFGLASPRPAAIHIGPNPTFGETRLKVEVHVIGCSDALLGCELEVEFVRRLRGVVRFATPDALIDQLRRDVAAAVAAVEGLPLEEIPSADHPGEP